MYKIVWSELSEDSFICRFNAIPYFLFRNNKSAMARAVNVSRAQLEGYLKGRQKPGFDVLKKINEIGVNINWLLSGHGDIFDPETFVTAALKGKICTDDMKRGWYVE